MRKKTQKIVCIGASAGGLDAIIELVKNITDIVDYAYVIIQHLSPDHKSLMPDLLSKHTSLTIKTVEDNLNIEPNTIYLNQNKQNLIIENERFKLTPRSRKKELNRPIDTFLVSLAESYKDKSIAVILSGTGTDGVDGIKAVKKNGGIICAQDPSSAQFESMPSNAIASELVDVIATPKEIGKAISHKEIQTLALVDNASIELLATLKKVSGLDLFGYKKTTLNRRLQKRLSSLNLSNLSELSSLLYKDTEEKLSLVNDLLISTTSFFRDKEVFDAIENKIIDQLYQKANNHSTIRIWVPGCSSGEEAYSIAILFDLVLSEKRKNIDFKIYATDVNPLIIKKAKTGKYALKQNTELNKHIFKKYFTETKDTFQIKKSIRNKVVFSSHNVLTDPPLVSMDFVSCRNLLIYLKKESQLQVIQNFGQSIKNNGFLLLGTSESISESDFGFNPVDKKLKIFKNAKMEAPKDNNTFRPLETPNNDKIPEIIMTPEKKANIESSIPENIYCKFLSDFYSPNLIILDSSLNILFTKGDALAKLKIKEGVFNKKITEIVDTALSIQIRNGIDNAKKNSGKLKVTDIALSNKGALVDLTFIKIDLQNNGEEQFIIAFGEEKKQAQSKTIKSGDIDKIAKKRIEELEKQLIEKDERLGEMQDLLHSSQEELYGLNERLIKANEELQGTNEELHGTNEELRSVNEELQTVNSEFLQKNKELKDVYNDLNNLYDTQEIATIFLDVDLKIRLLTPGIKKYLKLKETDIGRSLSDFMFFENDTRDIILEEAKKTVAHGTTYDTNILSEENNFLIRIRPFKNKSKIAGAGITLVDIHDLVTVKKKLSAAELQYENLFENINALYEHFKIELDDKGNPIDLVFLDINSKAAAYHQESKEDLLGKSLAESPLMTESDFIGYLKSSYEVASSKTPQSLYSFKSKSDSHWKSEIYSPKELEVIFVSLDITSSKKLELALKKTTDELNYAQDLSKLAYWSFDLATQKVSWSKGLYELFGMDPNEPPTPYEEQKKLYTEESWNTLTTAVSKAISEGISYELELEMLTDQVPLGWIRAMGEPIFDENNHVIGLRGTTQEITKHKESKNELEYLNTRLNLTLDVGEYATWNWNLEKNEITEYNPIWNSIFEIDPKHVVEHFADRIHQDDIEEVNAIFEEHVANRTEKYHQIFRFYDPEKINFKWIENSGKVVEWNNDGSPKRVIGVSSDITEQKEIEEKIRAEERFKDSLTNNSSPGLYIYDFETGLNTYSNKGYEKILGWTIDEINQLSGEEFFNLFHPDDHQKINDHMEIIRAKKIEDKVQYKFKHKQGHWVDCLSVDIPFEYNDEGNVKSFLGSFVDVSDMVDAFNKLEKEQKFRASITESSSSGIYIVDVKQGKNAYINRRGAEILGYTVKEIEQMSPATFASHFHPDDVDNVMAHMERLKSEKRELSIRYRFKTKSGKYIHCYSLDSPYEFDTNGELVSYIGSYIDITELVKKEEELIQAKNEAVHANQQKSMFLANLSHEIRTPMNGVVGFSKLLKKENLTKEDRLGFISQIEENSHQLMTLIDDILTLSKLDSGMIRIKKQVINLDKLLLQLVENHQQQLIDKQDEKGLTISYLNKSNTHLGILSDNVRLSQVINNLITNAIKYSNKGQIKVGYSKDEAQNKLSISVSDEGVGIKKDQLKLIFDRFAQVHEELADQSGGIGLGLAISKAIVTSMGGKIHVTSTYGKGSTFTVTIPYIEANLSQRNEQKGKLKKIIVADDSPSIQFYYKSLLEKHVNTLLQAYDGVEVLDLLKEHHDVDLILMDMRMPRMDGPSTLKKLREFNHTVRVVGQSAFAMEDQVEHFKSEGFEEYLTKPVDDTKILELIE